MYENILYQVEVLLKQSIVQYIEEKFFYRRVTNNSITTKKITIENIEMMSLVIDRIYDLVENNYKNINNRIKNNMYILIKMLYIMLYNYCCQINKSGVYKKELMKKYILQSIRQKDQRLLTKKLYIKIKFPRIIKIYRKVKYKRAEN